MTHKKIFDKFWYDRFQFVAAFCHEFIRLNLKINYPDSGINFVELFMYRLANTEGFIEDNCKRIERRIFFPVYVMRLFNPLTFLYYLKKPQHEIYFPSKISPTKAGEIKRLLKNAQNIYILSLPNYLKFLIKNRRNFDICNNSLLIIPNSMKSLINDGSLGKAQVIFLEDILYAASYDSIKPAYYWKEKLTLPNLRYRGVTFSFLLPAFYKMVRKFQWQSILISYLDLVINSVINDEEKKIIVCRDRRCMENIFLQVGKIKGFKTECNLHGLLTSNYDDLQLYTCNYNFIDEVVCFSSIQKNAIIKKQSTLGYKIPEVKEVYSSISWQWRECVDRPYTVLFVSDNFNDKSNYRYIHANISRINALNCKFVFRPSPSQKRQFQCRSEALVVDVSPALVNRYANCENLIVVGAISTVLLELASHGALPIFLKNYSPSDDRLGFFSFEYFSYYNQRFDKNIITEHNDLFSVLNTLINTNREDKSLFLETTKYFINDIGFPGA